MKLIKKYFINKRNSVHSKQSVVRNYPNCFNKVGIISQSGLRPDTNFITKLKIAFGNNIQIFIFVLGDYNKADGSYFSLSLKDFNYLGRIKSEQISSVLKELDVIVDITLTRSIEKTYALIHSPKAYKITLGNGICENCNLNINIDTPDLNIFADEIIKYHNILRHG